ncbi:MAG: hypothetical protein LBE99_02585 [Puniceicoccales bacterium]|nr:hypothetical protein [Puniceicoccales bacterium]
MDGGDWAISMDFENLRGLGIEGLCVGLVWTLVRALRGTLEVVAGSGGICKCVAFNSMGCVLIEIVCWVSSAFVGESVFGR